jgi:hypothetical protein
MLAGLMSDSHGCMAWLLTKYLKGGAARRAPGLSWFYSELANGTVPFCVDGESAEAGWWWDEWTTRSSEFDSNCTRTTQERYLTLCNRHTWGTERERRYTKPHTRKIAFMLVPGTFGIRYSLPRDSYLAAAESRLSSAVLTRVRRWQTCNNEICKCCSNWLLF